MTLCRLDAFESAELPALLQTGTHARQLLLKGVGQSAQQRLNLRRADLQLKTTTTTTIYSVLSWSHTVLKH